MIYSDAGIRAWVYVRDTQVREIGRIPHPLSTAKSFAEGEESSREKEAERGSRTKQEG